MALTSSILAPFIGASVLAGEGEYDDIVKACVAELAENLGLSDLDKTVATELDKLTKLSDAEFDEYLTTSAKAVSDTEAVLLICLDVLASDLVISLDEMANYFAFADILSISEDRASEIFDEFVDAVDDLTIETED